jgi:polysaccharide pyruvyl transferase WcaK-like protein
VDSENPPRIVLTATWSYFNKGDMLVLASTIDLVRRLYPKSKVSIVAPDCESYVWASLNDRCFKDIDTHPTLTRIRPFRDVRRGCSMQRRFTRHLFDSLPSSFWIAALVCFVSIFPVLYLTSEFRKTLRTLSEASLILWCSGNLFFAPKGYGLLSTFEEMFTLFLCKMMLRKATIFAPISLGPIESATTRTLLKNLLNKVDYILLREAESYEYVRTIGVTNSNIGVSTDSAFMYELELPLRRFDAEKPPLVVGVTPILATPSGIEATEQCLEAIAVFLRNLMDKGSRIVLLPFSPIECDSTATEYILNSLGPARNVVKHELAYLNSEELLRRVSEVDILMAMRLHSVIAASLIGIPSIAIVGQKNKFWGILRRLKMEDYALDLESLTDESLELKFARLLQDMDTIRSRLREIVPRMREDATSLRHLLETFLPHPTEPRRGSHP